MPPPPARFVLAAAISLLTVPSPAQAADAPEALSPGDSFVDPIGGTWEALFPFEPGAVPRRRTQHSVIRDPIRKRLILFGGWDGGRDLADVWVGSLDGPVSWQSLPVAGTPPTARRAHVAVYDPVRDRMLIFGGTTGSLIEYPNLNDVWELSLSDPPTWQPIVPQNTPPTRRYRSAGVYDPVADRLVIFGGFDFAFRNDTWALALGGAPRWTQLTPAGTPPRGREGMSAAYDPIRHRMVVFGGFDDGNHMNDTWALSLEGGTTWQQLLPAGTAPSPRRLSSLDYDPISDRLLLFGGRDLWAGRPDSWSLTLGESPAWTEIARDGLRPSRRWGQAAAFDPAGNRLVVFGGSGQTGILDDTWVLATDGTPEWRQGLDAGLTTPGTRRAHAAIYDPVAEQVVVFGGVRVAPDAVRLNDVWVLPMDQEGGWEELHPSGTPPTPRFVSAAAYDAARNRMLVFGGHDGAFRNDTWALQLGESPVWVPIEPVGERPEARDDLHGIYDPVHDRFVIFGGYDGYQLRNDVWALSLGSQPRWTKLEPLGEPPSPRRSMSVTYDPVRRHLIVFGGWDGGLGFNDAWWLSLDEGPVWKRVRLGSEAPEARWGHAAAYDVHRDRLLVMGGVSVTNWLNDVWSLSLGRPTAWARLEPDGPLPERRLTHSATYDAARQRLIVYGGYIHTTYLGDTWSLSFLQEGEAYPLGGNDRRTATAHEFRGAWPNPLRQGDDLRLVLAVPPSSNDRATMTLIVGLYDVRGRRVAVLHDGPAPIREGRVSVTWGAPLRAGAGLDAGVYFLLAREPHGSFRHRERVVLLR